MKKKALQKRKGRSEAKFGRGRTLGLRVKMRCGLMEISSKMRSVFIDWTSPKDGKRMQMGYMKMKASLS